MPWRAIFGVLVVVIAILGAGLWLLSGDEDTVDTATDPDEAGTDVTTSTSSTTSTSTTSTSTTSPPGAAELGPPTLDDGSTVSTVGLDTVTFGMTVASAQVAAGTILIPDGPVTECYVVTPAGGPDGVTFVVSAGTIERVDVSRGPVTTRSGVGVGTPEDTVIDLFGSQIERDVNPDGTVDLVFVPNDPGDANYRVVFTVGDGTVQHLRAGRLPEVLLPAGCEGAAGG
ncbi:MAG: hypothetical protein ACE5GB_07575 [Acidimicrobiales bacterium]